MLHSACALAYCNPSAPKRAGPAGVRRTYASVPLPVGHCSKLFTPLSALPQLQFLSYLLHGSRHAIRKVHFDLLREHEKAYEEELQLDPIEMDDYGCAGLDARVTGCLATVPVHQLALLPSADEANACLQVRAGL